MRSWRTGAQRSTLCTLQLLFHLTSAAKLYFTSGFFHADNGHCLLSTKVSCLMLYPQRVPFDIISMVTVCFRSTCHLLWYIPNLPVCWVITFYQRVFFDAISQTYQRLPFDIIGMFTVYFRPTCQLWYIPNLPACYIPLKRIPDLHT